jgi:protein gp37
MADRSAIEWTDATWNPTRGCSRVSPGCGGPGHAGGCYAEGVAARFSNPGFPYHGFAERKRTGSKWTGKVALIDHMLTVPLRWTKPRRIFVNSMSDLFHEALSDDDIDKVFAVMALCSQHTFQVLTKRPMRMRDYFSCSTSDICERIIFAASCLGHPHCFTAADLWTLWPLPNVWLGTSVEDQTRADERIPLLLATPAAVRFLSCEPLLGPVDLRRISTHGGWYDALAGWRDVREGPAPEGIVDWVIAGGESGPGARPMHPDWARSLRDQCTAAEVPFFFKQWGEWLPGENYGETLPWPPARWQDGESGQHSTCKRDDEDAYPEWRHFGTPGEPGAFALRVGKKKSGRRLDGIEHNGFPDLEQRSAT